MTQCFDLHRVQPDIFMWEEPEPLFLTGLQPALSIEDFCCGLKILTRNDLQNNPCSKFWIALDGWVLTGMEMWSIRAISYNVINKWRRNCLKQAKPIGVSVHRRNCRLKESLPAKPKKTRYMTAAVKIWIRIRFKKNWRKMYHSPYV